MVRGKNRYSADPKSYNTQTLNFYRIENSFGQKRAYRSCIDNALDGKCVIKKKALPNRGEFSRA
jgi:hypothetical protein